MLIVLQNELLNEIEKVLEGQQTIILNKMNKKFKQSNQQIQIDKNILKCLETIILFQ